MRILFWNLENYFVREGPPGPLKSEKKIQGIINTLKKSDADLNFFCELGGEESLTDIKIRMGKGKFSSFLKGNSDRHIELGLVGKNNPKYTYRHHGFTHACLDTIRGKVARDILQYSIAKDSQSEPFLIIWAIHLKSQRTVELSDPNGKYQRSQEVKLLAKLINDWQESSPSTKHIVLGDFNGIVKMPQIDVEFRPLTENLTELSTCLPKDPYAPTGTFLNFNTHKMPQHLYFDTIFFSDNLKADIDFKNSGPFSPLNNKSETLKGPNSKGQKNFFPSDHLPLLLNFDI